MNKCERVRMRQLTALKTIHTPPHLVTTHPTPNPTHPRTNTHCYSPERAARIHYVVECVPLRTSRQAIVPTYRSSTWQVGRECAEGI